MGWSELFSSRSYVSPIMHNVFTDINKVHSIIAFKTAVRESVMRRWNEDGIEPDSPLVLAAALDPQFKKMKFLVVVLKQSVREELSQRKGTDFGNPLFSLLLSKRRSHLKLHLQKKENSIGYIVRR